MLSGTAQPPAVVNGAFPTESVNGFPNGTAALPSIFFASARNTGFYLTGGGFVGISQGGVGAFQIYRSGGISSVLQNPNGSASYIEITDAGTIGIVPAVGQALTVANAVARFIDGSIASPALSFSADTDTGIYRSAANILGFSCAGVQVASMDSGGMYGGNGATGSFYIRQAAGTATAPAFSFIGDTNTGIYRSAASQLGIATGGAARVLVGNALFHLQTGVVLRLGNNYVAVAPGAATGTVTIQDGAGVTYRIPVLV